MRNSILVRFVLAVVLAVTVQSCGGKKKAPEAVAFPDSLVNGELVATVNGSKITGHDLRVFTLIYQPQSRDSLTNRMFNVQLLSGLIDRLLLWQEAQAQGVTVSDSMEHFYVSRFEQSVGGADRLDTFLGSYGIQRGELDQTIHRDLMVRNYIQDDLGAGIHVNADSALAYYNDNLDRFMSKDSVWARHIILRSTPDETEKDKQEKIAKLEDLRRRVKAGEDFAALARKYSEGPSAPRGGDLGYFTRDQMVGPFSDAAFALAPGQVSDVVQTRFGYHLIYVVDKKKAERIPYANIEDQLIAGLQQRALSQEIEKHLKEARKVAIIEPNFDVGGLTQRESATFTR